MKNFYMDVTLSDICLYKVIQKWYIINEQYKSYLKYTNISNQHLSSLNYIYIDWITKDIFLNSS